MFGLFKNRTAQRSRKSSNQKAQLGVEVLLNRLNLGGGMWTDTPPEPAPLKHVQYNAADGTIAIEGSFDNDHAMIEASYDSYYGRWYVNVHVWGIHKDTFAKTYDETFRTVLSFAQRVTFRGGEGHDEFTNKAGLESYADGGPGHDKLIVEGMGRSRLTGDDAGDPFGGNDTLTGGWGSDTIAGGSGRDSIRGGNADDSLSGGPGVDIIDGEGENDTIHGDSENDSLYGSTGNDTIYGDTGDDTIWGGLGNDKLIGDDGFDTIYGEGDNDWLSGGYEWGPDGNTEDKLYGGLGGDIFAYQTRKVLGTLEPVYFLFWEISPEKKHVADEAKDFNASSGDIEINTQYI